MVPALPLICSLLLITPDLKVGPTTSKAGPTSLKGGPTTSKAGPTSLKGGPTSPKVGPTTSKTGPTSPKGGPTSPKGAPADQQRAPVEPFIAVGLWYAGRGARPPEAGSTDLDASRAELAVIRRAGFNSITTWINWRDAEPQRGTYALASIERLIAAAAQSDLKVDVRIFTGKSPEWSSSVEADRARFVSYALARLRLLPQVTSVEAADDSGDLGKAIRVGRNARTPIEARMEFWAAVSRGAQRVTFLDAEGGAGPSVLSLGETIGIVTRNQALFAPLRARAGGIRDVAGAQGAPVDVKLLESPQALVIVAVNFSPTVQKVTISFTPDIPEAIWQNLETTTSVHFVMGRAGPFLEHTFTPRDTLVLLIRKRLR